jgi:hypothetical protein
MFQVSFSFSPIYSFYAVFFLLALDGYPVSPRSEQKKSTESEKTPTKSPQRKIKQTVQNSISN